MFSGQRLPGRKAGDLEVHFDVEGSYHNATFPFRIDADKGQFIAVDGNLLHIGETKAELLDHLRKIAASKIALTWTRYIEIIYEVGIVEGVYRQKHHGLRPEDVRDGAVTSISLNFEVVEYSSPVTAKRHEPNIRRRVIRDDGHPHSEERRYEVPDDVIPFSQERLSALKHVQSAMSAIDQRLRALFAGTPKAITERLDTITTAQLALPTAEILEGTPDGSSASTTRQRSK